MSGQVITFYSYKGGVGRTMALANVGVILSRWGARVLCVDWDLEAPGLHNFFCELRPVQNSARRRGGVLAMLQGISHNQSLNWRRAVKTLVVPPGRRRLEASVKRRSPSTLDFLPAGDLPSKGATRSKPWSAIPRGYADGVQQIDLPRLFRDRGLGAALEQMRDEWKDRYDFVLVDSRTGLTDIGGICAIHLPDILVALSTLGRQSLDGTVAVARSAQEGRSRLPFDRSQLLVLPLLSRVDARVERELAFRWLKEAGRVLGALCLPWCHKNVEVAELVQALRIPYIPSYSYGEKLVVQEESTSDSESAAYSFEMVAALLAQRLGNTDMLINSRDRFISAAARQVSRLKAAQGEAVAYDVFISAVERDGQFAGRIARYLTEKGYSVASRFDEPAPGENWVQQLDNRLARSKSLVVIVGKERSSRQELETKLFFETSLDREDSDLGLRRTVVPVLRSGAPLVNLGFLRHFEHVREESMTLMGPKLSALLADTRT